MKKILALTLAVLMALGMSACAEELQGIELPPLPEVTPTPQPTFPVSDDPSPSPNEQTPSPTAGAPATDAPEQPPILLLVENSATVLKQYDPAEGTELILTFSYDMPRIHAEELPEVCARINEALATVEETFYTGDYYDGQGSYRGFSAMLEEAEDNYTYVQDTGESGRPLEFSDTLTAHVALVSEDVLSVSYSEYVYLGGAHGSYSQRAYNFDTKTGDRLTLDRLSTDFDALTEFLTAQMLPPLPRWQETMRIESRLRPISAATLRET